MMFERTFCGVSTFSSLDVMSADDVGALQVYSLLSNKSLRQKLTFERSSTAPGRQRLYAAKDQVLRCYE